jgi:addiction module HigA family antidote
MLPENRLPIHPDQILLEEFLNPLGLSQVALAAHIGVPVQRVNEIARGKRGITPESARLFAIAFDTRSEFWLNMQSNFDLIPSKPKQQMAFIATGWNQLNISRHHFPDTPLQSLFS